MPGFLSNQVRTRPICACEEADFQDQATRLLLALE